MQSRTQPREAVMPAAAASDVVQFKVYGGSVIRAAIFDDPVAAHRAANAVAANKSTRVEATVIMNRWPIDEDEQPDEADALKTIDKKPAPTAIIKVTPQDVSMTDAVIGTLEDKLRALTGRPIRLMRAA